MVPVKVVTSGKLLTVTPQISEGEEEFQYRLYKSLVVSKNPLMHGAVETYRVSGMQFSPRYLNERTSSPNPSLMRTLVKDSNFRPGLINLLQRYTSRDERSIFRLLGGDQTDEKVLREISGKKSYEDITHIVRNFLSRVPHVQIQEVLILSSPGYPIQKSLSDSFSSEGKKVSLRDIDDVFSLESNKYQLIVIPSVLQNVIDLRTYARELSRILSPGGIIVVMDNDYRDFTPPSVLLKGERGSNLFRSLLDISHMLVEASTIVTPGKERERIYRPRLEVASLLSRGGLSPVCTVSRGFDDIASLQQVIPGAESNFAWVAVNPTRKYDAVYTKGPLDGNTSSLRLILEYKTRRDVSIAAYFPKKGIINISVNLSGLKSGVNYDEEVLAYMTPWSVAQQTSSLVNQIMRENSLPMPYRLIDGTGGAGGNILAFLSNWNVSSISVYEKVPKFASFIRNNVELYTGKKVTQERDRYSLVVSVPVKESMKDLPIYMYDREFTGKDIKDMKDAVLFLDVPWVTEGCGYKLRGYMYAGRTLENVARDAFREGASLVVFKLPPGYRLDIPSIKKDLEKETLFFVQKDRSLYSNMNIPERRKRELSTTTTQASQEEPGVSVSPSPSYMRSTGVQGVVSDTRSVSLELFRCRLMVEMCDHFSALFEGYQLPRKKDDYYTWLWELIRTYNLNCMDPIIPALRTPISSRQITVEPFWPMEEYADLIKNIRTKYPSLIPLANSTLPFSEESIVKLRMAFAEEVARQKGENTRVVEEDLQGFALELYTMFEDISSRPGIDTSVFPSTSGNMTVLRLQPNPETASILFSLDNKFRTSSQNTSVSILTKKKESLQRRYQGTSFDRDLASVLLRYSNVMQPEKGAVYEGVNLHAAVPLPVFSMLQREMRVTTECFASPLNATLGSYMSAFPDVDAPFGSIGSFFTYDFREGGSYEANPPYTDDMIDAMITRMDTLLAQEVPLSFVIIVPNWSSPPIDKIRQSRWKQFEHVMKNTSFIAGQQHLESTIFTLSSGIVVFILQSERGIQRYPVPLTMKTLLTSSFGQAKLSLK